MWGNNDHGAQASVAKFLTDMEAAGVLLKVGGVKFNEPYTEYDPIQGDRLLLPDEMALLDAFVDVEAFIDNFVNDGYTPYGGDGPELQLDALHLAATDMNGYSTQGNPNRYIVLITDAPFHEDDYDPYTGSGSHYSEAEVVDELTESECKVYISLWGAGYEGIYSSLTVNTGALDPSGDQSSPIDRKYPLTKLRARIAADWPTD